MGKQNSRVLIVVFLGIFLALPGAIWLANVGDLADRTTKTVATVDQSTLRFTLTGEEEITAPLVETCKRRASADGCVSQFVDGDEVLIWYDTEDPTTIWQGTTPGGGWAIMLLYGGLAIITGGIALLLFSNGLTGALQRLLSPPRPGNQDKADGGDYCSMTSAVWPTTSGNTSDFTTTGTTWAG